MRLSRLSLHPTLFHHLFLHVGHSWHVCDHCPVQSIHCPHTRSLFLVSILHLARLCVPHPKGSALSLGAMNNLNVLYYWTWQLALLWDCLLWGHFSWNHTSLTSFASGVLLLLILNLGWHWLPDMWHTHWQTKLILFSSSSICLFENLSYI